MINYLKGKTVYLAGSIHHNDEDSGIGWREIITPKLEKFGLNVIDPCKQTLNGFGEVGADKKYLKELIKSKDFKKVKEVFFPILKKDLRCVDLSHFVIVNYRPTIRHIGTIHEVITAHQLQRKPVLLYYPPNEIEDFNPWMACLVKEKHIFDDWDKILNYLTEVDNGNFDTSLWY
jgi:hypothetical protein